MKAHSDETVVGIDPQDVTGFSAAMLGAMPDTSGRFDTASSTWNMDMMFSSTFHTPMEEPQDRISSLTGEATFTAYPTTQTTGSNLLFQFSNVGPDSQQPTDNSLSLLSPSQLSNMIGLSSSVPIIQPYRTQPLAGSDQEDPEGVERAIFDSLTLDRNVESNSLPFVLESYASWIGRVAFDPVKVARRSRDLIIKNYCDSEESRWTITLIANVFRKLVGSETMGEVWRPGYLPTVSTLVGQVRRNITMAKSSYSPSWEVDIQNVVRALDNTLEVVSIYYITTRVDEALELMQEAAPIFRRACPDLLGAPIHLQSLLLQPIESLRHYAVVDVLTSISIDRPMFFQYDTTFYPELGSSVLSFTDDVGLQWSHGIPDRVILAFARINALRHSPIWDVQAVEELETIIRDFVPIPSVSPEPFLTIARMTVQECWRQAAYIYLYMGLCRADASDPRVVQALSRFMKLLDTVKPGRVPDAFIMLGLIIAGVAARQPADRHTIGQRMTGVQEFRYKGASALSRLEYLWKEVDAQTRPAVWADFKDAYDKLKD